MCPHTAARCDLGLEGEIDPARREPVPRGPPGGAAPRPADPASALSRSWDEEHDRHVVKSLLASIRLEFKPATWRAFERKVQDGEPALDVAAELGLSVNSVLIAKSRVLKRLREKAAGLLDFP
jgi:hypothetical protein